MKLPALSGDMNKQEPFLDGFREGKVVYEDGVDTNRNILVAITHQGIFCKCRPLSVMNFLFIPHPSKSAQMLKSSNGFRLPKLERSPARMHRLSWVMVCKLV
jgi:hypothetical protein